MILAAIRNAIGLVRKGRQTADAVAAAEAAYADGAGLPGVVLAYTGSTPGAADDRAMEAVVVGLEGFERTIAQAALTLELASQTLAGAALELRDLEAVSARLRGGAALKDVLEGD